MQQQAQNPNGNPNGKPGGGNPPPGGKPGPGMGPGQGMGQRPVADPKDVTWKTDRVHGKTGEGKVVGSYFTKDGAPIKGKSSAEYQEWTEAARAAKTKENEALDKTRIPKGYKDYVRDYFDSLTPENK